MTASAVIVIPARYGSSRFAGKPLALIAGKTLLQRVIEVAQLAAQQAAEFTAAHIAILVATDDERILAHAKDLNVEAVMTPLECKTGTDRVFAAVKTLSEKPKFVINLQGDAPLTPPHFISALLKVLHENSELHFATPVIPLSWQALDQLRLEKQQTPFSGTTAILDRADNAIWFSKNIIPAMRHEKKSREQSDLSPVYQHVGLYAYSYVMLEKFVELPQTPYEQLEELEQLRALEHGYTIRAVKLQSTQYSALLGVDTQEDAKRVEALIAKYGEMKV